MTLFHNLSTFHVSTTQPFLLLLLLLLLLLHNVFFACFVCMCGTIHCVPLCFLWEFYVRLSYFLLDEIQPYSTSPPPPPHAPPSISIPLDLTYPTHPQAKNKQTKKKTTTKQQQTTATSSHRHRHTLAAQTHPYTQTNKRWGSGDGRLKIL